MEYQDGTSLGQSGGLGDIALACYPGVCDLTPHTT